MSYRMDGNLARVHVCRVARGEPFDRLPRFSLRAHVKTINAGVPTFKFQIAWMGRGYELFRKSGGAGTIRNARRIQAVRSAGNLVHTRSGTLFKGDRKRLSGKTTVV